MAEAKLIGTARCPVCSNAKARVTISKQQLAVLTCNGCNCQLFARSDRSDELVRAWVKRDDPPAPAPAPKPEPETKPAKKEPADTDWGI